MGNTITCCFKSQSNTAKLVDLKRNTLRLIDLPVTAAELMLEEPGHVVCPVTDFRPDLRIRALKADEILSRSVVYLLISCTRVKGKVSESEMAVIESICGRRRVKRRSSKVLPVVTERSGDCSGSRVEVLGEESDFGRLNIRFKQWKPALEPICE